MADEPDTRSSPGAGARYEEAPPECTSTLANPVKNNGYERAASVNDEMMERLSNDQGAEGNCFYNYFPAKYKETSILWHQFLSMNE